MEEVKCDFSYGTCRDAHTSFLQKIVSYCLTRKGTHMITKKWDLACGVVLGITSILLASCGTGSLSTPSPDPTPQSNSVEFRIQFPAPHSSNHLTVIVTNGESQPIFVRDHQTNCTILLFERQTNGQWHPLHNCAVMTPTLSHTISSGHALTVSLDSTTWPAGTYRINLEYTLGQQQSPTKTTYSASFVLPPGATGY